MMQIIPRHDLREPAFQPSQVCQQAHQLRSVEVVMLRLVLQVVQEVRRGHRTILSDILHGNLLALTSRDLGTAIAQQDAVAIRAARRSARYVGLAVGGVVNLLDPAIVVIGGGVAEALGQRYVEYAKEVAERQILASDARDVPIVASKLGDDAGLLGAALTAFVGMAAS